MSVAEAAVLQLRVDSTADEVDAQPGDGLCRTAAGRCTLRAALQEAVADDNVIVAGSTEARIVLPAGRFKITRPPNPLRVPDAENGDFDILGALTIVGAGASKTIIDGNGLDRVFHIERGALPCVPLSLCPASVGRSGMVTLSDMTITGGVAKGGLGLVVALLPVGGGILSVSNGGIDFIARATVTLRRVLVTGNRASNAGGIFATGNIVIEDSTISNNVGETSVGGIRLEGFSRIVNSTVTNNRVLSNCCALGALAYEGGLFGSGGGIDIRGGFVTLDNSTITNNYAVTGGGAIALGWAYTPETGAPTKPAGVVVLRNTLIAGNKSANGAANCQNIDGEFTSYGGNIEDRNDCSLTLDYDYTNLDPLLLPLGNYGGETPTQPVQSGSAAIGWGHDCPRMDQRGLPHPTATCTSGAVEHGAM